MTNSIHLSRLGRRSLLLCEILFFRGCLPFGMWTGKQLNILPSFQLKSGVNRLNAEVFHKLSLESLWGLHFNQIQGFHILPQGEDLLFRRLPFTVGVLEVPLWFANVLTSNKHVEVKIILSSPGSCTWAKQGEYLDLISGSTVVPFPR